jgi:hypothetical protein
MISITTDVIFKFVVARQEAGASNAEINRELACLKRMFTLAVQARELHGKPHIPMLQEEQRAAWVLRAGAVRGGPGAALPCSTPGRDSRI